MENRIEIVLIGSRALKEYGFDIKSVSSEGIKDIDIVVAKEDAFDLIRTIPCEKEKNRFFYKHVKEIPGGVWTSKTHTETKFLLDIATPEPHSALSALMGWCIKRQATLREIDPFVEPIPRVKVILPPLGLLYALKKGHIHRIIRCTSSQEQNIGVWHKQMKMYTWMREKLGYERMDKILYGDDRYGDPISPTYESKAPDLLEDVIRLVFLRNFDETNARVGDTPTDLEKTEEDFFKDNVERYIPHDELHRRVAKLYRGVEEELFSKYQDPGSVNLVKELYFKYPLSEHIQCFVEEISVLIAERKMIPTLVKCYKEAGVPFTQFYISKIKEDLREIVAHFGTNLCGKGHFWLRRYFLDHYSLISEIKNFDLRGLEKLSVKITGFEDFEKDEKTADLREMITKRLSKSYENSILVIFESVFDMGCFLHYNNFSEDSEVLDINAYIFDSYDDGESVRIDEITLNTQFIPKPVLDLIHQIAKGTLFYCGTSYNDYAIFDLDHQIGFHRKEKEWYIFFLKFARYEQNVHISGNVYRLSGEKTKDIDENYQLKVNCYYYESSDQSCGWANEYDGPELLFLSNYGVNPIECLNEFLEKVARTELELKKDKKPPRNPPCDSESYYYVKHTRNATSRDLRHY